jgi:tripartite ATP-independent transporter DctP family solute receptor
MKKILVVVVMLSLVLLMPVFAESQETIELRAGNVDSVGTPADLTLQYMAKLLEERTGGKLIMKSFVAGVLGKPPDMIEQVSMGSLDIFWGDISNFGPIIKDFNIFGMGFVWRDQQHMDLFLKSPRFEQMIEELRTKKGILTVSAACHRLPRDIFSKKPIKSAEDLVGMKFRVPGLEMYLKTFEGIGTNPVRIAYGEAYLALSQGLADGIENPLDAGYGMKFHQVAPHILRTGHIRTINMFCINEEKFKNLPEEYQQYLREVAKEGDAYYMKLMEEKEDEVIAKLKEEGATISEIDVTALQEKLIPVAQEQEKQGAWSEGLYEYIRTLK